MSRSIHIVAYEACTAVGLTAASCAAAVRVGISGVGDHPFMVDDIGDPLQSALVPTVDPKLTGPERLATLAWGPIEQLGQQLSLLHDQDVMVLVTLPEHRPGWTPEDEQVLVARLNEYCSSVIGSSARLKLHVVARGHAGSLAAVDQAAKAISALHCSAAIILSVDSYFEADTIDWLLEHQQLITAETRSSFLPGEAAAILVLMDNAVRRTLRLPSLAIILGSGVGHERVLIKDEEEESFGLGMNEAVSQAAATLNLPAEAVTDIYLDINGERYRSQEWAFVALRAWHVFRDPAAYIAPADLYGDVGAASGALFVTLAGQAWAQGGALGPHAMLCAGSEAGLRGVVILAQGQGAS